MTPNKQVSPAIRILRGERDASARATHLEAATEKYSVTTIERKQMSTTTNFKRIALVAVAALGLGVLSSVPSQATINSDVLTLSSATAAQTTAETYTATSATVSMSFFGAKGDSMTLTTALIEAPAGSTSVPVLRLIETSSAVIDSGIETLGAGATGTGVTTIPWGTNSKRDSSTVGLNVTSGISAISSTSSTSIKYAIYMANQGRNVNGPAAGTYKVKITPAAVGVGPLVNATAQTITITVTTAASASTVASATTSTAVMVSGVTADAALHAADSTVSTVKTISTTAAANIYVTLKNAAGVAAGESITATITGNGTLGIGSAKDNTAIKGRSINVLMGEYIGVWADGNAGTGTITITSTTGGVQIGTVKTVTWTSTTPTTIAAPSIAATESSVIAVGGSTTVWAFAKDGTNNVSGLVGGTSIWAYSSDTSVATVGTVAAYDATYGYSVVVTGVKVGTASISFGNASTASAATIKSPGLTVRVGVGTPSNVTVTTDKATYAPGEKITMTVTILDSTALPVIGNVSYANIFSSTGVTSSMNLSGTSTLPASTIADYSSITNTKTFTLYAPVNGGTVTFSWTGGTALATANQVAKTTVITVTDSGAAALAAVTALATTVASLKTLITTLTNLVLKIQKKVKA